MSNKIEELAAGCFEYIEGTLDGDVVEFDYKKFANLIIQECAEVAGCNSHVSGFSLGDLIKQHFGVE